MTKVKPIYFWQATVEVVQPITAERFRILQAAGELVWPASHPLIQGRAVPPNPTASGLMEGSS